MDASCGEVQSTNFTCKAQVLAKLHPFLAPNAGQSVPAAVSWRKSWTSKQYDKIGNIDSKVWPIWSHWNTSSRGSVGLLPARIASSLAYQPDISDTFNRCSFVYESVDSSPGLCCLLLSHIDSHPHLDALRFVRKLFPAQAAETRCEASDKNLISSQAWSLWIFMQHTHSQIM